MAAVSRWRRYLPKGDLRLPSVPVSLLHNGNEVLGSLRPVVALFNGIVLKVVGPLRSCFPISSGLVPLTFFISFHF